MKTRDRSIIFHMEEYCGKLLDYTQDMDYLSFKSDELRKDACSLCLLQIGEIGQHLSDAFKTEHAFVPWRQICSMHNIVAHHYGIVDFETVWDIILNDIPPLKEFCEKILY